MEKISNDITWEVDGSNLKTGRFPVVLADFAISCTVPMLGVVAGAVDRQNDRCLLSLLLGAWVGECQGEASLIFVPTEGRIYTFRGTVSKV